MFKGIIKIFKALLARLRRDLRKPESDEEEASIHQW
jgi:hypothetical protein